MNKKSKSILIFLLCGLILTYHLPNIMAVNVGTFFSEPSNIPIIDGTFETSVWDGNLASDITLYDITNQSNFLVVALMAVFNTTSDNLTLGFFIEDNTLGGDIIGIIFETNPANELYVDTPNWGFGGGHDFKVHYLDTNYGVDGITGLAEFDGSTDSTSGGDNHVFSKSAHTGSFYHVEMTAPLDSVELGTMDYSLAVNDVINFTLIYLDDNSGTTYTQYKESESNWDYCELNIAPHPTSTSGFSKIIVLISLSCFLPIIYINKKKCK